MVDTAVPGEGILYKRYLSKLVGLVFIRDAYRVKPWFILHSERVQRQ